MLSFGKQQPLHMVTKIKTVGENLFTSRVLKYKVCKVHVLTVSFDCGLSHRVHHIGVFSCRFTVAGSGIKKILSFFNNLPLRKHPSTVFWLKKAHSQPATECSLRYHPPSSTLPALIGASAFAFNKYPHKAYILWRPNSSRLLLIPFKKSKCYAMRNEKLFVKVGVTVNLSSGQPKINGRRQLRSHLLNTFD